MKTALTAAFGAAALLLSLDQPAAAHGVAGARVFVSTLTFEDPAVADELAFPTLQFQKQDDGTHRTDVNLDFQKTVTERFGVGIGAGFSALAARGTRKRTGWQNIEASAKYAAVISPEHEFMLSVGLSREFGATGSTQVDAERHGSTTPTLYAGKGFGDLPIGLLRPLAVTGMLGYAIPDKHLTFDGTDFNDGAERRWVGGIALHYSMEYLQTQVRRYDLPDFVQRLTPVVELTWSAPASRPYATGTQAVLAPGVIYSGHSYQLGIAALIPMTRDSGHHVGVIAQFHMFLDDILPASLGRPLIR